MANSLNCEFGGVKFELRADTDALERIEEFTGIHIGHFLSVDGEKVTIRQTKQVFAAMADSDYETVSKALNAPADFIAAKLKVAETFQRFIGGQDEESGEVATDPPAPPPADAPLPTTA